MPTTITYNNDTIQIRPDTEKDIFVRCCNQCNSGMNKGYLLNDSMTLCSKSCLQEHWNLDDNHIDSHIDEATEEDYLYFTEWEELVEFDDYEWYTKDGKQGDIKSLIPVLFTKSLSGDNDSFDVGFSLLKLLAENNSNFNFPLASTTNKDLTLSNIRSALKSLSSKETFVDDIIKLKLKRKQEKEEFFIWNADNELMPLGSFTTIDNALSDVPNMDMDYNFILNNDSLLNIVEEAKSIIEITNPNAWYALSYDGELNKLGVYDSISNAQNDNPDDILFYMNTEGLSDFITQYPVHNPSTIKTPITASVSNSFIPSDDGKPYEVELRDNTDLVKSEYYDTIHEANHRAGWVNKQKNFDWNDIVEYDFGSEQYFAFTSEGIQDLGYFYNGSRIEFDNKGNKINITTEEIADYKFGDENWSFISRESEARQQRDDLNIIKSIDDAPFVGLDSNGKIHPIHSDTYSDAVSEFENICNENGSTYVEIVPILDSFYWLKSLNSMMPNSPLYATPNQFGLDFNITELNPTLASQWIATINDRPHPKRIHTLTYSDTFEVVDDESGQISKIDISFIDDFEVGVNATTEDVYDKLLHFLEDTVINGDLTPFTFTPDNRAEIYDVFLEYLQDTVNTQDITAFSCSNVIHVNENPHFIVNEDFTLSYVENDDVACEEHDHGWFDTNNNVPTLLSALKKLHKTNKNKINHLPF